MSFDWRSIDFHRVVVILVSDDKDVVDDDDDHDVGVSHAAVGDTLGQGIHHLANKSFSILLLINQVVI